MFHKNRLFFLLLIIWLISCNPQKTETTPGKTPALGELPFETIEQKERPGGIIEGYKLADPTFVVITKEDEIPNISSLISNNALLSVKEINFNSFFCIVVLQGIKPTTGYSITIQSVTKNEGTLTIKANSLIPSPDIKKDDIVTSPYHLIKVEREAGLNGNYEFILIVDDQPVSTVEKTIP